MGARFFGQFLLERGVVRADDLERAAAYQAERNEKIGDIAVAGGLLSREDANRINREQLTTDARFGEIAVNLGLLTEAQVAMLVEKQAASRIYIGEALVHLGLLSKEKLNSELIEHRQEEADEWRNVEHSWSSIPWARAPMYRRSVELTSRFFARMVHLSTKEGAPRVVRDSLPQEDVQAAVALSGGWAGDYVLRMGWDIARYTAARLLGSAVTQRARVVDTAKEAARVVCDQLCSAVQPDGIRCTPASPREMPSNEPVDYAGCRLTIFTLASSRGNVEVAVIPTVSGLDTDDL